MKALSRSHVFAFLSILLMTTACATNVEDAEEEAEETASEASGLSACSVWSAAAGAGAKSTCGCQGSVGHSTAHIGLGIYVVTRPTAFDAQLQVTCVDTHQHTLVKTSTWDSPQLFCPSGMKVLTHKCRIRAHNTRGD